MKPLQIFTAFSACATACSAFLLPKPSGPYHVGIRRYVQRMHVEHTGAEHRLLANVTTEYMLTVYYPTLERSEPAPYLQPGFIERAEKYIRGLRYNKGDLAKILAHRTWNASYLPVEGKVPSDTPPGPTLFYDSRLRFPSSDSQNVLLSDLASHGYTIAAIDHPTEQIYLQYPNGEEHVSPANFDIEHIDNPTFWWLPQMATFRRCNATLDLLETWPGLVDEWKAPFAKDNIGLLGNEMGGSAALDVANHTKVAALAVLTLSVPYGHKSPTWGFHGMMRQDIDRFPVFEQGIDKLGLDVRKPMIYMGTCKQHARSYWARWLLPHTIWRWFCIDKTRPMDFTDWAIWKEFMGHRKIMNHRIVWDSDDQERFWALGPINGHRASELICYVIRAFFDRMLRDNVPYDPILEENVGIKELWLLRGSFQRNKLKHAFQHIGGLYMGPVLGVS